MTLVQIVDNAINIEEHCWGCIGYVVSFRNPGTWRLFHSAVSVATHAFSPSVASCQPLTPPEVLISRHVPWIQQDSNLHLTHFECATSTIWALDPCAGVINSPSSRGRSSVSSSCDTSPFVLFSYLFLVACFHQVTYLVPDCAHGGSLLVAFLR